jgi:hypothetical protein
MKRIRGIFTDCQPIDQPEGTYRNARNIEINTSLGAIVSERGNTEGITINGDILGSLLLPTGNTLLFVKHTGDNFKILEITNNGTLHATHLDVTLPTGDYVQATFNINAQGETVVYWVDGTNPPYFLVLSNTTQTTLPNTLFPKIDSVAQFANAYSVNTGGNLKSGAYYFALAYVDEDGNKTNFFNVSNPVSVTQKIGEGSRANIPTASSIVLNITNIDTDYKKLRIVVIPQYDKIIGEVLQLPDINITSSTLNYTYSGSESTTISSLNDVIIDAPDYSSAKTITTSNGRLYLGNLEKDEDINYQQFANSITTHCVRQETALVNDNSFVDINPSVKTFKGDEVYAFYIAWMLKNGKMSKAYHIPGRQSVSNLPAISASTSEHKLTITKDVESNETQDFSFIISIDNTYTATNNFIMTFVLTRTSEFGTERFETDGISVVTGNTHTQVLSSLELAIEALGINLLGSINTNQLTITSDTFYGTQFSASFVEISNNVIGDNRDELTTSSAFESLISKTTTSSFNPLLKPDSKMAEVRLGFPISGFITVNIKRNETVSLVYDNIIAAYNTSSSSLDSNEKYTLSKINNDLIITSNSQNSLYNSVTLTSANYSNLSFTSLLTLTQSGTTGQSQTGETASSSIVGFNKMYQVVSTPDNTYNMGYWENENETYPAGFGINGNVRHHKFPDASNALYRHYNNNNMVQLGVQFGNIQVPSGLQDKVLGYKIYYAKRDDNNRTILDTAVAHPVNLDIPTNEVRSTNYYTGTLSNYTHIQSLYPFNLLRTKKPITGITHVKVVGELFNEIQAGNYGQEDTNIKVTKVQGIKPYNINLIEPVSAKSYIDFNEQDTIVSIPDFSTPKFRMDRTESRLLIQTSGLEPGNSIELVNLLTPKSNIYNSFENQFLVDTGYYQPINVNNTLQSTNIFNGDTFISQYTYKITRAINKTYNVQINKTVITSEDDIYLRTYGDKQWQGKLTPYRLGAARWTAERTFIYKWDEGSREGIEAINNYIDYNNDYSSLPIIKPAFTYNSDTDRTVFNTRIIRNVDSPLTFRTFRADDYIDLTGNRGELVKLTNYNNILIPHLQRALVRTKGQEELQVNDIRAFLGTGDIFSVKPDELIYTEEGFAGIQDFNHSISTPFGYLFIDKQSRKVFRLDNDGLSEISNNGLYNYFYDNIPNMADIKFGYDPKLKRILFSNSIDRISYYPEFNAWMSFHDYQPDFMFRTYDKFFTTKANKLYLHNTANYTLYGGTHPMVYSFTDNTAPNVSKIVDSITIIGEVKDANGQVDKIINTIKLSNSTQETDVINIVNNNTFEYINTTRKTKNEWNINKFRATTDVTGDYSWAYKKRIEDKFVNVDITFTSGTDRIYIYGILVNFKPSIR